MYKRQKLKYDTLKKSTRKKSSAIRAEHYKTGGGISTATPLTSTEEKIKNMILLSVEGNDSVYDSDQVVYQGMHIINSIHYYIIIV